MTHACIMDSAPQTKFTSIISLWLKDEGKFVPMVHYFETLLALSLSPMTQPLHFPGGQEKCRVFQLSSD